MVERPMGGKTVVVTGAGQELGLGIAHRFAQAGAYVVLAENDPAAGDQAAQMLRGEGLVAVYEPLDVHRPEQSLALVNRLAGQGKRLDVWVNNTAVSLPGPAESLSPTRWQESLDVILSGAFYCAQAAGRQMLAQGRGVIINVASVVGYKPIEGRVAYSVAQAGLIALTETLGVEWGRRGVRVVGIAPAVVVDEARQEIMEPGDVAADVYRRRTPLRRPGTIREIAETVLFLAGDRASYITAETLPVDGGWVAYQLF